MSVRIRPRSMLVSGLALSAILLSVPTQAASPTADSAAKDEPGIHESKDTPNTFDQPYVPGYNQSPQADVRDKGAPSVASEPQQANRLADEPKLPEQEAGWEDRSGYMTTSENAVGFWTDRVDGLDPETVRLDRLKERLTALERYQKALQDADQQSWSADRAAFEQELAALREEYMELPQARKSGSVARRTGDAATSSDDAGTATERTSAPEESTD